jgi:acetoin utilization protein AcuB
MRLEQIMKSPVETITSDASVADARERMRRQRIHHLVVANGRGVTGVLSARDLIGVAAGARVDSVMAEHVVSAAPSTTVREAANLLRGRTVGCLPVLERGRVVGMVTITDLLELIGRGAERPTPKSTRWTLRARGPRKSRPSADRRSPSFSR